jgi:PAS domain S-box-containing protein
VFRRVWRTGLPEHHPIATYRDNRIAGWRENFVYKLPSGEIVAVYDDRTEQKQAEEALRKSEEQFRNFINQAPYGVFVTNEKGDFIVVNEAACRTTGYIADELLTMNMVDLIPPEDRRKALDHFHSVLHTGKAFGELMYRTQQGEHRVWTINAVKLNDRMLMGFANDITEMKRAQNEIMDYQRQLQAMSSELALAEERQRRMVATELHDGIGQLLSVTRIKMQRLLSDLRDSGQVQEIAQILDLIVRAIRDSRALMFELSPPMLYELGLEAAIDWLGEQFRTRYGLAFEFHDDGQPKPLSEDKRVLLFHIVRELFYNVVKHARARTLSARMEKHDDRYRIRIEDAGLGFAWNPAGSGESGSGFGLFSIRERLRYIGGSIEIQPVRREAERAFRSRRLCKPPEGAFFLAFVPFSSVP